MWSLHWHAVYNDQPSNLDVYFLSLNVLIVFEEIETSIYILLRSSALKYNKLLKFAAKKTRIASFLFLNMMADNDREIM